MKTPISVALITVLVLSLSASISFGAGELARALRTLPKGVVQITPQLFIDDPTQADQAQQALGLARRDVAVFFGRKRGDPRLILCTAAPCRDRFLGANAPDGKTWGSRLVVLGPQGITRLTMAHELTHVELHRIAGLRVARFPTWFGEGLAGWVSRDARLTASTPAQRVQIKQAHRFGPWTRAVDQMGWKSAYGAALDLVAGVAETAGPDALRRFIEQVAAGGDFDRLWHALPGAR